MVRIRETGRAARRGLINGVGRHCRGGVVHDAGSQADSSAGSTTAASGVAKWKLKLSTTYSRTIRRRGPRTRPPGHVRSRTGGSHSLLPFRLPIPSVWFRFLSAPVRAGSAGRSSPPPSPPSGGDGRVVAQDGQVTSETSSTQLVTPRVLRERSGAGAVRMRPVPGGGTGPRCQKVEPGCLGALSVGHQLGGVMLLADEAEPEFGHRRSGTTRPSS
jgi:hypothetical protein